MNQQSTNLKNEDLQLNVQNIPKKYVNVYVKNEAFLFVYFVIPLRNTKLMMYMDILES